MCWHSSSIHHRVDPGWTLLSPSGHFRFILSTIYTSSSSWRKKNPLLLSPKGGQEEELSHPSEPRPVIEQEEEVEGLWQSRVWPPLAPIELDDQIRGRQVASRKEEEEDTEEEEEGKHTVVLQDVSPEMFEPYFSNILRCLHQMVNRNSIMGFSSSRVIPSVLKYSWENGCPR